MIWRLLTTTSTPINIPKIWGSGRTNKAMELHQTLFSYPNKKKKGLVHKTTAVPASVKIIIRIILNGACIGDDNSLDLLDKHCKVYI